MAINPANIIQLLVEHFSEAQISEIKEEERRLANFFIEKIQQPIDFIEEESLFLNECDPYEENSDEDEAESLIESTSNEEDIFEPENPKQPRREISEESKEKAWNFYKSGSKGCRSVRSMRGKGFTWIRNYEDLRTHVIQ